MDHLASNWISYAVVIIITALFVAVITEQATIARIQLSDGIIFMNGKCRLKTNTPNQTQQPTQEMFMSLQNDIQYIKSKLS